MTVCYFKCDVIRVLLYVVVALVDQMPQLRFAATTVCILSLQFHNTCGNLFEQRRISPIPLFCYLVVTGEFMKM